jgi:hypothetical protein
MENKQAKTDMNMEVLGYTKSGKAVYNINVISDIFGREGLHIDFLKRYKDFTKEDHKDAMELHYTQLDVCNENWQIAYDSVTPDQWNNDNDPIGQKACKETKEAGKQFDKHEKLAVWHRRLSE